MEVDSDPRLDMSLDELIKKNSKKGAPKGERGRRSSVRGRGGRGRGPRAVPHTPTGVRARQSQQRSADKRQSRLAEKRGLGVSPGQGVQKNQGRNIRVRAVPLHTASFGRGRGPRGRGGIRVGGRGAGLGRGGGTGRRGDQSLGDFGSIKITIDNRQALQQPRLPAQQILPPHLAASPAVPAWGSAQYMSQVPAYQPQTFRTPNAAPYMPFGGGVGTSQGAPRNGAAQYGYRAAQGASSGNAGFRGGAMNGRAGGSYQAPVRLTSNGLRY